jgi:hypothetical protein
MVYCSGDMELGMVNQEGLPCPFFGSSIVSIFIEWTIVPVALGVLISILNPLHIYIAGKEIADEK